MNRSEFLKVMGLSEGGILLPSQLFTQKEVKIYDNYLSGMHYYEYGKIKKRIKEGDVLILKREAENPYDSYAVEVFFESFKLGYLRAYENICIANMLDAGVAFKCFVSKHQPYAIVHNHLSISVFAELIKATSQLYTELENLRADDAPDIYRKFR